MHHLDVYRLEHLNEALDVGLAEMLDDGSLVVIEWGDAIVPVLPRDFLEVRLAFGDGDDDRELRFRPVGPPVGGRGRGALADARGTVGWTVLILGIETATAQVGCAIGGHEGVLASTHSARGKRHAESLAPAIEFTCRQARVELTEIGVVAVDLGPGLFTGLRVGVATAKAMAQALRVPMIGVPSLDLLAFPVRFSPRLIAAVIDARRGEVFSALYRQVPGGVQRVTEPQVGTPDELASELVARGEEVLMVGDGALRYARPSGRSSASRSSSRAGPPVGPVARAARPRAGAAGGVGAARGSWRRSTCAGPTPRSTGRPGTACDGRPRRGARPGRPRGRRHADAPPPPAGGAAHRAPRLPAPVVARALHERARPAVHPRVPGRPDRPERRRLRRPDDRRRGRPHHDRRGRPAVAPPGRRHPAAPRPARPGAWPAACTTSPSRCGCPTRRRRRCTAASASPRPACAAATTSTTRGRDGHVGPRHRRPRRADRRARIAAAVPGRTVLEGLS